MTSVWRGSGQRVSDDYVTLYQADRHLRVIRCHPCRRWLVWTAGSTILHVRHKSTCTSLGKMCYTWRRLCWETVKQFCLWSTVSMFFLLLIDQPSYIWLKALIGMYQRFQNSMINVNLHGNVPCLKRYWIRILLGTAGFCESEQQEAQLLQRDRATLRVTWLSHSRSQKSFE